MRTAVVVDDEPITRLDLGEILTEIGFQVVAQASDGFDAVEACRQYRPDLVLTDIKMPVFDGLSAAETIIREGLAGCVVLLTAFLDQEFLERAKEIGAAGYLIKPVEERTLRPAVEIALAQSQRCRRAENSARQLEQKLAENKLIDRAKQILAQRDSIPEQEAYAQMRTLSMNRQRPLIEIARAVVASDPERGLVDQAKAVLMHQGLNENTAFRKIKALSAKNGCSMAQAAREIIHQRESLPVSPIPGGKDDVT